MGENQDFVGHMIANLARAYSATVNKGLQPHGLAQAQYQAMSALEERGEQTQRSLAVHLGVEQATMANTLARMDRDHLITRRPHPDDRRAQLVTLSEKARTLLGPARQAVSQADQALLTALPEAERALFVSMLSRLSEAINSAAEKTDM
jgi:DNA-binding MarR family transcriptional regulator